MIGPRICRDCGKESRWPLARERCRTCYPKHVLQLQASEQFESVWHRPAIDRVLDQAIAGFGGCVLWTGTVNRGYGRVFVTRKSTRMVHRITFEEFVGPIPEGMELDHVCHTRDSSCPGGSNCLHRRCVNPAHLEVVTSEENNRRSKSFSALNAVKTECAQGHPYTPENTYWRTVAGGTQRRLCKTCAAAWQVAYRQCKRERLNES